MWINIYLAKKSKDLFSDGEIYTSPNVAYENRKRFLIYVKTSKIV